MSYHGVAASGRVLYSTDDDNLIGFSELIGDCSGVINGNTVRAIRGINVSPVTPGVGHVLVYDGSEIVSSGIVSMSSNHNLLSPTHTDTTSAPPAQGALIVGSGGSPSWAPLYLGAQEFVLYSNGTDLVYTRLGAVTPFSRGTAGSPSFTFTTDLDTGWSDEVDDTMIGTVGGISLLTLNGPSTRLHVNGGQASKVTTTTNGYILNSSDYIVAVNHSVDVTITLPSGAVTGQTHIIKDANGNASSATRITIAPASGLIDGNTNVAIRNKYGSFTLVFNGTQWNVI